MKIIAFTNPSLPYRNMAPFPVVHEGKTTAQPKRCFRRSDSRRMPCARRSGTGSFPWPRKCAPGPIGSDGSCPRSAQDIDNGEWQGANLPGKLWVAIREGPDAAGHGGM